MLTFRRFPIQVLNNHPRAANRTALPAAGAIVVRANSSVGSGSDGAVGLSRIKEQGGVTLVQAPEDAEFDGMPRAAIETGMIDRALPGGNTVKAEAPAELL
jgi:chemotaxis response regulator CheB